MRKRSVKVKITLWYLLLMGLMAGLMLVFLRLISGSVYTQSAMEQLDQTVRENLGQVTLVDGRPQMGEGFQFYENGVYTLVYSQDKTLLAGQVPVAFTAAEPFHNGLTRLVDTDTGQYYVLDFWVPAGWEEGLWVRGLLEVPAGAQSMPALLWVAAVSLPLFLLLAAVGGYWIARRAFRPLEHITATADAISQASDLSARVAVPPGGNEFSRLAATFNQMFARLEQSFEAETQFTADASHELRTPVSVIKSACEYGETYGETLEEQRETLAMIHRQADKMSQLIDQLLRITRLDQGTELARRERVDLAALAREVCAEGPWPQDRLTLEGGEPIFVQVDRALIARLLQNLIDNGFKYGKPGGGGLGDPSPPGRGGTAHRAGRWDWHCPGPAGTGVAAVLPGGPRSGREERRRSGPVYGLEDCPGPRRTHEPGERARSGEFFYPPPSSGEIGRKKEGLSGKISCSFHVSMVR